jgi:hypothetical protein
MDKTFTVLAYVLRDELTKLFTYQLHTSVFHPGHSFMNREHLPIPLLLFESIRAGIYAWIG